MQTYRLRCLGLLFLISIGVYSQNFEKVFQNKTLRIDYIFSGNASHQSISVDELSCLPTWAGRRNHLSELLLRGNGQIIMKDSATKVCIYKNSFSSLFQEWISTPEAKRTSRAFENTFLLPYPKKTAIIEISLESSRNKVTATLKHIVNPHDILIHQRGITHLTPHRYIIKNGNEKQCIDVAILPEGYTQDEMELFYKDAQRACESIFSYEPFKSEEQKFNVVAVAYPSIDSGISVPRKNEWRNTAFHSHFDTFYSDRYLTTRDMKEIHNALAGIPYEHIIIIANTEVYGGGGIFNSITLTAAHHPMFRPVITHEFGHAFGGLADEYYYDDDMEETYPLDVEPWEPNITTLVNFDSKWKDMLKKGTPIPTPFKDRKKYPIGAYEGGGYSSKGIYRPSIDCRMKTNGYPEFCPVCQRAIVRMIDFYTK
ncbi:MAG: IgA Peptidase M64 [Bacteroidaceae bacterium]|nr:IgA Peptidase M64 [Bacteroidaceae bacterium]